MRQFRLIARPITARVASNFVFTHQFRNYSRKPFTKPFKPVKPSPAAPKSQSPTTSIDPRLAFKTELQTIDSYATLLNQTSARSVRDLVDIKPMMAVYTALPPPLINPTAIKVVNALKQTTKDAAFFSRSFPQTEKAHFQYEVGSALLPHVDYMAQLVIKQQITDFRAIAQLFRTFEHLDPSGGIKLYEKMPNQNMWGGAVIPLLVKAGSPLPEIRQVFEREATHSGGLEQVNPRTAANMVLALVKYEEVDTGTALFQTLMESEAVSQATKQFLIDILLGDAPLDLALRSFDQFPAHVPHHSAMARLLARLDGKVSFGNQLAVFGEYLKRLKIPSELSIKPVAHQMVANLVKPEMTVDQIISPIVELCEVYALYVPQHELLLNIILTAVTQQFPDLSAEPIIFDLIGNYGPIATPVSFRVRLNALEHINAFDLMVELWEARQAQPDLQKWDWFALMRADRGGSYFQSQWDAHNQPFRADIARFRKSRGY